MVLARSELLTKKLTAAVAIPARRIVKFGASDDLVTLATDASDLLIGVSTTIDSDEDESCDVFLAGIAPVEYGGTVTRGQLLTSDSVGRAVASSDGDRTIGIATQSGVVGDHGFVLIYSARNDGAASITATPADLNVWDNALAGADITVGTEAGNVINVAIQLEDAAGAAIATRASVYAYLSDDANGDSLIATVTSGAVAIGTDGLANVIEAKKQFRLTSESDGDIDINITESGGKTLYLVLVMPNGSLVVSPAITFA